MNRTVLWIIMILLLVVSGACSGKKSDTGKVIGAINVGTDLTNFR